MPVEGWSLEFILWAFLCGWVPDALLEAFGPFQKFFARGSRLGIGEFSLADDI